MILEISADGEEGRKVSSFLKKRSKKLLNLSSGASFNPWARALPSMNKSFLVLFFKKERLAFPVFQRVGRPGQVPVSEQDTETFNAVLEGFVA